MNYRVLPSCVRRLTNMHVPYAAAWLLVLLVFACTAFAQPASATGLTAGSVDESTQAPAAEETVDEEPPPYTGKGDIAAGTYYICSSYANDRVVCLDKKSKKNGIEAKIKQVRGTKAQRWIVAFDAKGFATIRNASTGRYLTCLDKKAKAGTDVAQWKKQSKNAKTQRWIVKKQGSGYVICSAINKKRVLQASGKKANEELSVTIQKRTNKKRQLFTLVPEKAAAAEPGTQVIEDGTYALNLAAVNGLAVTVEDSSKDAGANVHMWATGGVAGQAFKIAYDGKGYYTLTNVYSKKNLAVARSCAVPGMNIVQSTSKKTNLSKWRIDSFKTGYRFVNKATGLALAIPKTACENGDNVFGNKPNKGKKQLFNLVPTTAVSPAFSGVYYLTMAKKPSRVVEPVDCLRHNNVKAQIYKKRTKDTNVQKVRLKKAGKGLYYIQNVATKRVLSLAGTSKKERSSIVYAYNLKKKRNKWSIVLNEDMSVSFKNAYSGTMLTVSGGNTDKGTKLKAKNATAKLAPAQKFWLQGTEKVKEQVVLDVPCYMQNPQLPTGCESVALTNELRYWGFKLGKTTMAYHWIPYGSDGVYNFIGSPSNESGWIICAPGIERTANKYMSSKDSSLVAVNITGTSLRGLRTYLDQGYPVIIWTTIGLGSPGYATYKHGYPLRSNNHAIVLSGYDPESGKYRVADSLAGTVWRSGGIFTTRYNQMGKQAVVILD